MGASVAAAFGQSNEAAFPAGRSPIREETKPCYHTGVNDLDAAVAALRKDPTKPVRAKVLDMTVELRAILDGAPETTAAEAFAGIGPWEGESTEGLMELLSAHRRVNRDISKL